MITTYHEPDHRILCGSSLAPMDLPELEVDHLITDPPYSARTHGGHNQVKGMGYRSADKTVKCQRKAINYNCWDPATVKLAVELWAPVIRGWWVVMSDHELQRSWEAELRGQGLYVFSPLPFVSPGSRVRITGDGPSSWTTWITVARPRHEPYSKWGTLQGSYEAKPEKMPVVGGKPLGLMRQLVADYSREGETVWDPCCGGGTTLVAAKELGRRSIGMDLDRAHCEIAGERLRKAQQTTIKFPADIGGEQGRMF